MQAGEQSRAYQSSGIDFTSPIEQQLGCSHVAAVRCYMQRRQIVLLSTNSNRCLYNAKAVNMADNKLQLSANNKTERK